MTDSNRPTKEPAKRREWFTICDEIMQLGMPLPRRSDGSAYVRPDSPKTAQRPPDKT